MARKRSACFALLLTGCSVFTVRSPSSSPLTPRDDCTTSPAAPLVDTVVAGAAVALLAYSMSRAGNPDLHTWDGAWNDVGWGVTGALLSIPPALGFAGSAIYGYVQVSRCAARNARFEQASDPRLGVSGHVCRPAAMPGAAGTCDDGSPCVDGRCIAYSPDEGRACRAVPGHADAWACSGDLVCNDAHLCARAAR